MRQGFPWQRNDSLWLPGNFRFGSKPEYQDFPDLLSNSRCFQSGIVTARNWFHFETDLLTELGGNAPSSSSWTCIDSA
jgi:hypothetical protein